MTAIYKIYCLILLSSYIMWYCECYNILIVVPHPAKSHFLAFEPLFRTLASKGHNITVIGPFPRTKNIPNYTDINLSEKTPPMVNIIPVSKFSGIRLEKYLTTVVISQFSKHSCEAGLSSDVFQKFINKTHSFDIILMEYFNTNCFMGLVKKFKAPVIGFSSAVIMPWSNKWFGNPNNPSYIPGLFMDYIDEMTLVERLENTVMLVVNNLLYTYFMDYPGNKLSKMYMGEDLHKDGDIMYKSSLLLVNTHFTLNGVKPLVPAVVEVGGLHISEPTKLLPNNIEKWINESSEGVIYFSLGSMIKGHTFPDDKRLAFLKAFSRLPHRVLWKWENETMVGKPDNVMIQKWLPQFDILCHPNVKAFISHGGLLGTIEAVHCGVPVMVMPQFGDQFTNAKALEANGGGLILYLQEATEENIYNTLRKLLSTRFRTKAKELSERFRDRPMPPLDTAVYWVEYVARHRGAPHMRTAAVDMPFYKYYLLDVMAFLLAIFLGSCYLFFSCVRIIVRRFAKVPQKIKSS